MLKTSVKNVVELVKKLQAKKQKGFVAKRSLL
jgi:hypothetical protein